VRDKSYTLLGENIVISGLNIYVTGTDAAPRGSPGLIVAHDIFGPDSGRTKEICDVLARRLRVLVILPDFFHGDPFFPEAYGESMHSWSGVGESLLDLFFRCRALELLFSSNKRASWEVVGRDFEDICVPMLQQRGCEKIGVLGFCWGGWLGCHAAANEHISCVGAFHPSLVPCMLVGESKVELCAGVRCPVLMLPAREDAADVKSAGLLHRSIAQKSRLLEEQSVFREFTDMRHGE
jgi:dienelactone hydrolase